MTESMEFHASGRGWSNAPRINNGVDEEGTL